MSPLFQVLENCSRRACWWWSYLEQQVGAEPFWPTLELLSAVRTGLCLHLAAAKEGSRTGLGPSDLFQLLHPPGKPAHTKILPWVKPEHKADKEVSLCRWAASMCRCNTSLPWSQWCYTVSDTGLWAWEGLWHVHRRLWTITLLLQLCRWLGYPGVSASSAVKLPWSCRHSWLGLVFAQHL